MDEHRLTSYLLMSALIILALLVTPFLVLWTSSRLRLS